MMKNNSSKIAKNSTKIGPQTIFKYINIIIVLILMVCIRGFLQFRDYCQSKGYHATSIDSFKWCGFGFFAVFIAKYSYFYFMRNKIDSIVDPKYSGQTRIWKRQFVLKLSYDACFYLLATITAFIMFRKQYWFPTIVGGHGSCYQIYKQYPNWPSNYRYQIQMYFMIQLGVHTFSVFEMVVLKRKTQKRFYQYLLHHFVAATLILFSTMCNQIAAGMMTLIIHDMSDIFIAFTRGFVETIFCKIKVVSILLSVITLFLWIYLRIIIFPSCLLANVYINAPLPTDQWYMIRFQYLYLLYTAFVLFGMHLYWTFYILKSGLKILTKKKFINTHEGLENPTNIENQVSNTEKLQQIHLDA